MFISTTLRLPGRLNTIGSITDLNRAGVVLESGLIVRLYSEDFKATGTVEFSEDERIWVARFEWQQLRSLTADY